MTRRRKLYLGPDVAADVKIPKTSTWRYEVSGHDGRGPGSSASQSDSAGSGAGFHNEQLLDDDTVGEEPRQRLGSSGISDTPPPNEERGNITTNVISEQDDGAMGGEPRHRLGSSGVNNISPSNDERGCSPINVISHQACSGGYVQSHSSETACSSHGSPERSSSSVSSPAGSFRSNSSSVSSPSKSNSSHPSSPSESSQSNSSYLSSAAGSSRSNSSHHSSSGKNSSSAGSVERDHGDAADQESGNEGDREEIPPPQQEPPDVHQIPENGPQNGPEQPPNQPSHSKLRRRMQGDFDPTIETRVSVSRNDALYMALGLAIRDKFSNTAFSHAVQLINALFAAPVLPPTIDLLDSLLVCDLGVKYFFFCSECSQSFGELPHKQMKNHICPNCSKLNIISDLRVAHFFVMFSIPHQLENLLQNDEVYSALKTPSEAVANSRRGVISDIWDGTVYKSFAAAVRHILCRVVSFHFSVDGSPLSVSSLCSIWPILLVLNELPPELRMSNLLLGGLWFGKKAARMDLFLEPFVNQFRSLSEGFSMKIRGVIERTVAYCIGCCADSGARGKVQGIKTHSGYHSCNWCTIRGEWNGGAVRFPLTVERPCDRTHEAIVTAQTLLVDNPLLEQEEIGQDNIDEGVPDPGIPEAELHLLGVNAVSPLINMPHFIDEEGNRIPSFNMVDSFFVDSMHMIDLGISKFFLQRWFEDYGTDYYVKGSTEEINRRISILRPPCEFRRVPPMMDKRAKYTSRESHNWIMFCCFPVLKGILRDKYLKAVLILIQGLYLLNQTEITVEDLECADTLINTFLVQSQEYYGPIDMTFNLHILKHLVQHTVRNGPSWTTNAYCFEDGNGSLKKIIHSNQGVPHQVIRALSWIESLKILEGVASDKAKDYVKKISKTQHQKQQSTVVGNARLIGKPEPFELSPEEIFECENHGHTQENLERYSKVIFKGSAFTDDCKRSRVYNNSVGQLNSRKIVLIRKIFFDSEKNEIFLFVSEVNFETVLDPPPGVHLARDSHFFRKITSIDEEIMYVKCTDLKIICFVAAMPEGEFVAPFPNVHNRH